MLKGTHLIISKIFSQFIEFPQDGQACAKVIVNGNELPIVATGKSKRIAKKEAAFKALAHLKKNGGC